MTRSPSFRSSGLVMFAVLGLGSSRMEKSAKSAESRGKERDEREFDLRRSTRDVEPIRFQKQIKG